ncbi:MAG: hypothetical protein WC135_06690 [Bacteroidales bacterium]
MKRIVLILVLMLPFISCSKSSKVTEEIIEYEINGILSLKIPPNFELKEEPKYKEVNNVRILSYSDYELSEGIRFLTKGYEEPKSNNGGIKITIVPLNPSDKLNIKDLTEEEIETLNDSHKAMYEDNYKDLNLKITKWIPLKKENVGGEFCLRTRYNVDGEGAVFSNGEMRAEEYLFMINDKSIEIIFTHCDSNNDLPKDFEKVVKSIKII